VRLRLAAAAALGGLLAACASTGDRSSTAGGPRERGFAIIQINDVYKIEGLEQGRVGGLARVRTLRKQLEESGRPVLILHAGDFLFPSVMSKYLKGGPMIEALNRLDGDPAAFDPHLLVTFGNHEFDDRDPGVLLGRVAQSDFDWLATNARYRTVKDARPEAFGRRVRNVHPHVVREVGGVRVGIFGLVLDDQPQDYVAYDYSDLAARKALVEQAIAALRAAGAEYVVALTHQDLEDDLAMARDVPAIDLVVGGHEHIHLERQVGTTWVTKSDADAKTVIVHDVGPGADGRLASRHRRVALDATVAPDPALSALADASLARLNRAIQQATGRPADAVLGTTEHTLEGVEPAIRGRETALGNFLADAICARMAADIAFINGGAVRINDDIPAGGQIRAVEMEGIFYFDNAVVATEVTGAELVDLLRISVSQADLGHGRFLQVSGMRFRYHAEGEGDDRTFRVDSADVEIGTESTGFQPLDPARRYRAATLDYLWENGYRDGYPLFSRGKGGGATSPPRLDDTTTRLSWRRVTEEAIAALPDRRVRTAIEGRIVRQERETPASVRPIG
jgi:5'-nucleotidase